jgi:transposase
MKKLSSKRTQSPKRKAIRTEHPIAIGLDLGDKTSRYCVLNEAGEVEAEGQVATTRKALLEMFKGLEGCRLGMEVGTHSPWVSRLLSELGYEVYVANARQVRVISESSRKSDRVDAEMLARLVRVDPKLLRPIRHRSKEAQADLMKIRVRAGLVEARTGLINEARGLAKAMGERVPACAADSVGVKELESLSAELRENLKPLLEQVEGMTVGIKALEAELEQIAREKYPETKLLEQVSGVGTLIALTLVLTVEDKSRFERSRDVGCYVGLRPKRSESGESAPQLPISKEGDRYLRQLLVQGANWILSRLGPDTDLKRWGLKLAGHGGKNARKRAVVAVARKLAILLHRLWVTGEVYEPLRNSRVKASAA